MNGLLSTAADAMQGRLQGADGPFSGVSTDTRTLASGELFFALAGPNFDGGKFVGRAQAKGAAGAVVASVTDDAIAQIEVDDTRLALGQLGAAWRADRPATIVGVTGSNGKTTLKEMIAACLGQIAPTLATAGNLNNEIGVPLMLLRIADEHRFAVIEMGANHVGEIAYLTSLAKPDVVVITNAGVAHLEGFGSIQGIARGKGEILEDDKRPAVAVLNAEDEFFNYWLSLVDDIEVISFGLGQGADVHASGIRTEDGLTQFRLHLPTAECDVRLPLVGEHNVRNACAAAAVATALDVPAGSIVAGLESIQPVSGRLEALTGRDGATIYDDSYNANPVSVRAASEYLVTLPGRNWLVLGDMFELGEDAEAMHRDLGESIRDHRIDRLFALGDLSRNTAEGFGDRAEWFESIDDLIAALIRDLAADVNVLVKGSRGMRMERVVDALRPAAAASREA